MLANLQHQDTVVSKSPDMCPLLSENALLLHVIFPSFLHWWRSCFLQVNSNAKKYLKQSTTINDSATHTVAMTENRNATSAEKTGKIHVKAYSLKDVFSELFSELSSVVDDFSYTRISLPTLVIDAVGILILWHIRSPFLQLIFTSISYHKSLVYA